MPILSTCPVNPASTNPCMHKVYFQGKGSMPKIVWEGDEDSEDQEEENEESEEESPMPRCRTRATKSVVCYDSDDDPKASQASKHPKTPVPLHDGDSDPPVHLGGSIINISSSSSPPHQGPVAGNKCKQPIDESRAVMKKIKMEKGKVTQTAFKSLVKTSGKGKKKLMVRSKSVLTNTTSEGEDDVPKVIEKPCPKPKPAHSKPMEMSAIPRPPPSTSTSNNPKVPSPLHQETTQILFSPIMSAPWSHLLTKRLRYL